MDSPRRKPVWPRLLPVSRRPGHATKRTTVTFSTETWSYLDHVSRETHRTLSEVVEWYVLRGVETWISVPKNDLGAYRDVVLPPR